MKYLAGFILFVCLLFGYENDINSTDSNISTIKKDTVFLSYTKKPDRVFVGQIFSLEAKAIIAEKEFDEIKTEILNDNGFDILNLDEKWKWYSDEVFFKTFYLKAKESNATFPDMEFKLYNFGTLIASKKFPKIELKIVNLNSDKYFCNVLAQSLEILKSKTTTFNENSVITVLEIKAKNANLKDFKLSWVDRDGIDSYKKDTPYSTIYYYAIIPKDTKIFKFTYFNVKKNRFVTKKVDIIIDNEKISTQSELNPQKNSFELYKNIGYILVGSILLVLLLKRRKIVYFILLCLIIAIFIYSFNPLNDIKISPNTKIRILPTKNSTIFYVTKKTVYAQKLGTRKDYIKVILPNGKIGWIKDKNVIEN